MNRIQRYIIKEIFPVFIMGNIVFMFLLLLEKIVDLADLFFAKNVPFFLLAETIIFFTPSLFTMTIPLACLLAVLISFSRLSADSELIAMKASGGSNLSLIKPVIFFGILSFMCALLMSCYLVSKGSTLALNNLNKIVENISINDLKENEMYENIPGIILFVKHKISNKDFEGIITISMKEGTVITALKGYIAPTDAKTLELNFQNGKVTLVSKDGETTGISFENLIFNMPMQVKLAAAINTPMTMTILQLAKEAKNNPKAAFELSKRFAVPASAIIMCLFGFSLGVYLSRSGKSFGIIISIGIAFFYNFIMLYIENLAGQGKINPYLSAWIPNAIFSLMLLYFLKRAFK